MVFRAGDGREWFKVLKKSFVAPAVAMDRWLA
jgi:hypothetical protein